MGALTHTYCDYATGNDYKGASFVDGAFTVADMTLTKVGAFAASAVNHWLLLDDNGSGNVTPGYYKIASKTSDNAVVLATSPKSGATDPTDVVCTQATGTALLPWRSVQGALDLITRDATNGDQINVKAGTAQVSQAALALTTYGTPAEAAPLLLRGYTATANDGGMGEIDCNGAIMFAAATNHVHLGWLECHNFGNNNGITLGTAYSSITHCEVHKGASTPSGKTLVVGISRITNCHIHDAGTTGVATSSSALYSVIGCYIYNCPTGISSIIALALDNIIVDSPVNGILTGVDSSIVIGNTVYSSTAATGNGIQLGLNANQTNHICVNNIIEGYSGTGGKGILSAGDIGVVGHNVFYNNATNESYSGDIFIDLGGDATPASSPFTNAAAGNFSLNAAVAGAIEAAFPDGAWYGLATTTNAMDIGAVQKGAGAGSGGMLQANKRGNKL